MITLLLVCNVSIKHKIVLINVYMEIYCDGTYKCRQESGVGRYKNILKKRLFHLIIACDTI